MKKKSIALLMAVVMLFGTVVGGTIAWLTATSLEVKNTFTVGDINVKLDESLLVENNDGTYSIDENSRVQANTYQLVPGTTYPKDPIVTIEGNENNVDCYLFVKFEENASALTYTSALLGNDWIKLDTEVNGEDADVWYRDVTASSSNQSWELLAPETVTVKNDITKDTMPSESQTLVWKAYAVQKDNLTVAQAWDLVDPTV